MRGKGWIAAHSACRLLFCQRPSKWMLSPLWCCLVTKLFTTLCDPVDGSLPGFSVYGISQAQILDWVAISFSSGQQEQHTNRFVSFPGISISLIIVIVLSNFKRALGKNGLKRQVSSTLARLTSAKYPQLPTILPVSSLSLESLKFHCLVLYSIPQLPEGCGKVLA